MPSLRQLRSGSRTADESGISFDQYAEWVTTAGASFPIGPNVIFGADGNRRAEISDHFLSHAGVYRSNATVFACMLLRHSIFSEVTFRFQGINNGKPGKFFGTPDLDILNTPWPGGTTGELTARMIQDVDLAGNFFAVERNGRLYRRAPHKVHIIMSGDPLIDEFVDVVGYVYRPHEGGPASTYLPHEMCHWAPTPDPLADFRGMSWLTPVIREIQADNAATDHKMRFFDNGATPQVIVKFPENVMTEPEFDRFKKKLERDQAGTRNAYKTLYLAPGADATVVGSTLAQLDFSNSQGRDETRIAAAAGIPPVILGQKESLGGSSLNQGNFATARRRMSDGTFQPLYRSASAALSSIAKPPQDRGASRLWYDDSQIAFFREDQSDAATIQGTKATTISTLVQAGYTPESCVAAVEAQDNTLLVHSGYVSVQLQKLGADAPSKSTGASG